METNESSPSPPPSPSPQHPSQPLSSTRPESSSQPPSPTSTPSQHLSSSPNPSPKPPLSQSQSSTPPPSQVTMLEIENIAAATQEIENEILPEQQESVGAPTSITPTTSIMPNQERPQQQNFRQRTQIFIICIFLQILFAIMNLLAKLAMDDGMSSFVYVAYRSIFAFLVITPFAFYFEWNQLPKMTMGIFFRILALSVLGLLDQDLYLLGMKYTTATYATAMSNLLPVITFILACIRRTENLNIRSRRHQAKVLGTLVIVLGAMVMTVVKGSILFGTVGAINHGHHGGSHTIIGLMFILAGCVCFAYYSILQTIVINEYHYPALSLLSFISFLRSVEGLLVALIVEGRTYYTIWMIFRWDLPLLSAIYAGIFCSGLGYYLEAVVMQARGPVYVSWFGPLSMIFVAFLEVFLLGEQLLLGRLIGAIVICVGLYCAIWGEPEMSLGHHKTPKIRLITSGDRGNSIYSLIIYLIVCSPLLRFSIRLVQRLDY